MKQKTRFKIFGNIGYRSMNGRYIDIGPKKAVSVDLYYFLLLCQKLASPVNWTRYRRSCNYILCQTCDIPFVRTTVRLTSSFLQWSVPLILATDFLLIIPQVERFKEKMFLTNKVLRSFISWLPMTSVTSSKSRWDRAAVIGRRQTPRAVRYPHSRPWVALSWPGPDPSTSLVVMHTLSSLAEMEGDV